MDRILDLMAIGVASLSKLMELYNKAKMGELTDEMIDAEIKTIEESAKSESEKNWSDLRDAG